MKKINSGIIFENNEIVCIAIGKSNNTKTGNMLQTYILVKGVDPITANRTGLDKLICGNCPHKGTPNPNKTSGNADNRSCYVNLGQGVLQVWKAYKKGNYPLLTPLQIEEIGKGRMVRIGTYGDGAFVPDNIWETLTKHAEGVTTYTHQGLNAHNRYMQSADSLEQAKKAWAHGKRTFRVIKLIEEKQDNEILCPASKEQGAKVQCNECKLCNGTKAAKSIAIVAHGTGKNNFKGAIA